MEPLPSREHPCSVAGARVLTTLPHPAPTLVAGAFVLDAPTVEDAEAWSAAQDEECARWFGWPCPPGVDRCRDYLTGVVRGDDAGESTVWAIRADGALVGGIDVSRVEGRWNVAYFVHPEHRGRGIASSALRRVCAWAFHEQGLDELATVVHVDNAASRAVLERAGFRHTGSLATDEGDRVEALYRLPADERGRGLAQP